MLQDGKIRIGTSTKGPVFLRPEMANRHGLIAGATGTGKTVTLKVLAEGFSDMGVPVFLSDIKSDLTGMVKPGTRTDAIDKRLIKCGIDPESFEFHDFPTALWDVYGKNGKPIQSTVRGMGAQLLGRMLGLNETQTGVLGILFRYCDQYGYPLETLGDLKAKLILMGEHAKEFTLQYGNVSVTTVGAIQRAVATLEEEGGGVFFQAPEFNVFEWMKLDENGRGMINILSADELFTHPLMYSTFLLWMLTRLYERLPERGDAEKPLVVFFFDEAHLLFDDCSRTLMDKIEQVVRLIRSKGVGVYFITQSPADIPMSVLGQLGNRVQHALRAYTPLDQKAVKVAAQTFRANEEFNTEDAITGLKTGEALVSCLDEDGAPGVVERTTILPPQSHLGAITPEERAWVAGGRALSEMPASGNPAEEAPESRVPPAAADLLNPAGGMPADLPAETAAPDERPMGAAPVQAQEAAGMPAWERPVLCVAEEPADPETPAGAPGENPWTQEAPPVWPEPATPFTEPEPVPSPQIPQLEIPAVYQPQGMNDTVPVLEIPITSTTPEPVQEITGQKKMSQTFKVFDPVTGQYVEQEKPDMTPVAEPAPAAQAVPTIQVQPAQAVPTIQVQPAAQQPVYQQPVAQQPVYQQPAVQQPVYQQPVVQQPVYQQMPVMIQDPVTGQYVQQTMLMQQDPATGNWIPVQQAPVTQTPVQQTMDPIALAEQQKAAAAAQKEAEKAALQAQKEAEKAEKEAARAAKEQEAAERRARNDALREEAAERARRNDSVAGRIKNAAISTATRQVTSTLTKGLTNAINDLFGGGKKK